MIVPVERRGVPATIPSSGAGAWLASRSDGARLHAGVDLGGAVGTPVLAPEGGTIARVIHASRPREPNASRPAGWSGYGPKAIVLRGDSGAWHLLAHLGTAEVTLGQVVTEGDRIGTIGALAHGPHLHWEVRAVERPTRGAATVETSADPAAWLAGTWSPWAGQCPPSPAADSRTPRACRPGFRGPVPPPFVRRSRARARHQSRGRAASGGLHG